VGQHRVLWIWRAVSGRLPQRSALYREWLFPTSVQDLLWAGPKGAAADTIAHENTNRETQLRTNETAAFSDTIITANFNAHNFKANFRANCEANCEA
jgi:hypothetical protein